MAEFTRESVVIANGQSESAEVAVMGDRRVMLVYIPAGFVGDVSVQIKLTDGTFDWLRHNGLDGTTAHDIVSIPEPAGGWANGGWYRFPDAVEAADVFRFSSHDGSGVAAVQTADRTIEVLVKGI